MQLSGLSRRLDLRRPNNVAALVIAGLVFGMGYVAALDGDGGRWAALLAGAEAGGTAFAAWVVGREIDPEHPASAVLAALGVFAVSAITVAFGQVPDPAFMACAFMALATRVAAGTTGREPTFADALVMAAFAAGAASLASGIWMGAAGLLVALSGTRALAARWPLRAPWIGIVVVAGVVGAVVAHPGELVAPVVPDVAVASILLAAYAVWLISAAATHDRSVGQWLRTALAEPTDSGDALLLGRVLAARAALVAGLAAAAAAGGLLGELWPLLIVAVSPLLVRGMMSVVKGGAR